MPLRFATLVAVALLAAAACDAENENDVGCAPADCEATCESLGFPGGACEGDVCACDTSDTDPFEWDGGSDADTDTDADAGETLG
jgi:hypothetical protein